MRVIAFLALAACSAHHAPTSAPPDAASPILLEPFTPLLCTEGFPGSPSCPYNRFALGEAVTVGSELEMIIQPMSQDLYLTDLLVDVGDQGLYVEGLRLEVWPCTTPAPGFWPTIDMAAGTRTTLADATLSGVTAGTEICIVYDAIGGYR
jgi:hypothetical protein